VEEVVVAAVGLVGRVTLGCLPQPYSSSSSSSNNNNNNNNCWQ
jgi:hypothetical protein